MATTTANMGLTKWDSVGDYFSHAQLAANFQAIDVHDHTANKGVQIPFGGLAAGSVGASELRANAVLTASIANSQVTKAKFAADVDYETALSSWKMVVPWTGGYSTTAPASGTHLLGQGQPAWGGSGNSSAVFYLDPADFAAGSRTTKYRVRALANSNLNPPGTSVTATVALYSGIIATSSSSGNPNSYGGTNIGGTAIAFNTWNIFSQGVGAEITAPAAGFYALGVFLSASTNAGVVLDIRACLEMRQV